MGLTKPRAAQIFNLDYKQSTRVVTATNITLTGGAPNLVDGVTLSLGDRVLVTGQNTGSQNGLYQVTTLGSGANGTWARTSDGNENGEIEAGMIVMVTEGTIYADTQWKLITDDPIVINTTALTFTQNYMANSISGGTSNVVVNSNANVTISSAGTANVLTVSNTGAFVSGVVSATGNVTGNYILGNGSLLTGVSTSSANINNGTSNVTVVSSGGDVTVGIAGTSNVAVFANTGLAVTGVISASGNVTGGNLLTAGIVSATGNITGGNITTGIISATGAVTVLSTLSVLTSITVGSGGSSAIIRTGSGTLANPAYTFGVDQDTGIYRITTNQLGISAGGTNAATFSNTAVNLNYDTTVTGTLSATGNVTGGNFLTAGLISATSTITSAANITGGNITTSGLITATGNVTGGNVLTAGLVSATGNLQAGNIRTVGVISATGNGVIAGRDLLVGAAYTSYSSAGRGIVAINGTTDQIVEFANGVTNYGYLYHSGTNMTLLNNRAGTIDVNATNGNINFVTSSSQRVQIDSTGIVSVTGNVQAGNLRTAGLITATGNVQAGNLRTAGLASATGNVTGGNVTTAGIITATGNATAGNILTGGLISATGLVVSNGAYMRANSQVVVDSYSGSSEGGQISLAWTGVNGLTGQGNGTWNLDVDSSNTFRTFYQNATGTTNVMFTLNSTNQTANFSGNIGASYYYGNGAFLTGIVGGGGGGGANIANGATSITIPVSSGNIAMSVAGQSNTVVINLGSFTMYGTFAGPKTLQANVTVAPAVNALLLGPVTVDDGYSITVPTNSSLSTYGDASPDIVGSTVVVSGNITGGNIRTAGEITATGNVTGFNILAAGLISATGNITGGSMFTAGLISATGNITGNNIFTSGSILPTANATANIGSSSFQYNTVFARATSAQYADLAENYEADDTYEPGTVLCFGGSKEVTVCTIEDCTRVAGVVSTNPSYLMNSGQTGTHVVSLALQGRVPTRVTGQIRKGDLMVSAGNGRAKTNNKARAGTIIGKALANSEGDTVIEVVVGRD